MIFIWTITIPAWIYMMVLVFGAAIWEKFGSGIFFLLNLGLTILCFLSIPVFLGAVWLLIRKIGGKDDDTSYEEIFQMLIGTGVWALIGIGYFGGMVFG